MRAVFFSAVMMLSCSAAGAQTAEEAVAYILYQIENGSDIGKKFNSRGLAKQMGSSPARYNANLVSENFKTDVDVTVIKDEPCVYSVTQTVLTNGRPWNKTESVVDFSKSFSLVDAESASGKKGYSLKSSNACAVRFNYYNMGIKDVKNECRDTFVSVMDTGDATRVKKALDHLSTNFCKGRAF